MGRQTETVTKTFQAANGEAVTRGCACSRGEALDCVEA